MHFSDEDAELITKEFLADFDRKMQNFSLDDLERLARNLMEKDVSV